ncbi:branched-chain-amino-acid transaminase [candidate division WOR-1 bacterium RIFOXYB2_FULL_48_7]|uniref:Branched-chain-amino-acid aminotransferase n=1 Tax=candidate division WOR-1 bacterium RIFOXYB2_FULL_48_7 TaxID=1802583 RepID=A0A1F4TS43_UNCSA|nr:MAG: branched-chain-amino-acid transaminase [candidate division WOR-1 bacterium RIFOXYB2_FULL_48_7]
MNLQVKRVDVSGANFIGLRGAGRMSKKTIGWMKGQGVRAVAHLEIDGQRKALPIRLDDLPESMLAHTLLTGFNRQSFVQPADMAAVSTKVEVLLTNQEFGDKVAARLIDEAAPADDIDWSKLPFDLNLPERTTMYVAKVRHTYDAKKNTVRGSWEAQNPDHSKCLFPFSDTLESPAAQNKHYGQLCFEGIKAFRTIDGRLVIFRLRENALRLQRSARRLGMTPASVEWYMEAIRQAVLANKDLIPPPGNMAAMYIRPVQIGSGKRLGVKEAGEETLMIFVSPVGPYYPNGFEPIKIRTPNSSIRRSGNGLTGRVKAAGNYVMGLIELIFAKKQGFNEILWIRNHNGQYYPEEVGTSNLFYVIDGELYTPELSDTILPGVTRDSIIKLARALGIKVHEGEMPLTEVLARATEVFSTGTAAVVTPVGSITHLKQEVIFNEGKVGWMTQLLYNALVALQEGRFDDPALDGISPDLLEEFKADWIFYLEQERQPAV